MGGSIQYDKRSRRFYIDVYWDKQHHKIWSNPNTGEKFYDKRQANKLLGRIQTEVDEGDFHPRYWKPDSPMIVKEYYKEWLESVDVSDKTRRDYRGYFKNHIIPNLGATDIRHIRHKHLTVLHRKLKLSDKGKYNILGALKSMLRWAYRSEDISKVPPFPVLSFQLPEITYLTFEQQEKVLSQIPEEHRPIFETGMEYGLRTQEVRALQKDCIEGDEITIKRAFSDNTLNEKTKTGQVRRYQKTKYIIGILESIPFSLSPFVFVRKDGLPYTNKNLNTIWRNACKKADIKIKLQNALRHSLGCQLLDQGEDLDLVRQTLGHTKSEMTRRYAKRSNNVITNALDKRRAKVIQITGRTQNQQIEGS